MDRDTITIISVLIALSPFFIYFARRWISDIKNPPDVDDSYYEEFHSARYARIVILIFVYAALWVSMIVRILISKK